MTRTVHTVRFADARSLVHAPGETVDLVVTSPPYPMIAMWDAAFTSLDASIGPALAAEDGEAAFEAMHAVLDEVWRGCFQALRPGGIACINIGDATRSLGGEFRLWPNHARILLGAAEIGFHALPDILWRKPTNAPNKFLGSGMLPAGAYVTYEHEYVLVLRKGRKREFCSREAKLERAKSAFFWEERNAWFSDVWLDLRGEQQSLDDAESRGRSGAFPRELAYRLVNMFSVRGDVVLDPFLGTGTTLTAAAAAGRSSLGYEIDRGLEPVVRRNAGASIELGRRRAAERIAAHGAFVRERAAAGKPLQRWNASLRMPVMTRQESLLEIAIPDACGESSNAGADLTFEVSYIASALAAAPPASIVPASSPAPIA